MFGNELTSGENSRSQIGNAEKLVFGVYSLAVQIQVEILLDLLLQRSLFI